MKRKLNIEDIQGSLDKVLAQLLPGEEIILVRSNEPVAKLLPLPDKSKQRCPGTAKGLITNSDDFDAPLEDFEEYS